MSVKEGVNFFQFVHRVNPDKTIDTICAFCYLTAASAENEADLHEPESAHICWGPNAGREPRTRLQLGGNALSFRPATQSTRAPKRGNAYPI
jgi:hypothetical protein